MKAHSQALCCLGIYSSETIWAVFVCAIFGWDGHMWMGLYYKQFKLCSSPIDESENLCVSFLGGIVKCGWVYTINSLSSVLRL